MISTFLKSKKKTKPISLLWKAIHVSTRTIPFFTHTYFVSWLQGPVSAFYHGNLSVTESKTVSKIELMSKSLLPRLW